MLMAAEGLERYGYVEPARRIARRYLGMVYAEFQRTGHLFEKYDAMALSSEVEHHIQFGYSENQTGFGWTNACVLELLIISAPSGTVCPRPLPMLTAGRCIREPPGAMNEPAALDQPHWSGVRSEIERRLRAGRILIASDFDGTLSFIAPTPEAAVVLPAAREALDRLSRLPGVTVAVVSGRALNGVKQKLGLPALFYAGNHGLQIEGPDMPSLTMITEEVRKDLKAALTLLHDCLDSVAGVIIEDKGASLSVHYRQAAPPEYDTVASAVTAAPAFQSKSNCGTGRWFGNSGPVPDGTKAVP